MRKAKDVNNIVIHCSAGFGDVDSIKRFWKNTLGWNQVGYHLIVDLNGDIHVLADFSAITNGVAGNNTNSIHICYIGGVERAGKDKHGQTIFKGLDTRTPAQKYALHKCILKAKEWLQANGKDTSKNLLVCGHYDFSPDQNKDGVIATWERIKECPSFDARREYMAHSSTDMYNKLPGYKPVVTMPNFIIYVVKSGDTLSAIGKNYGVAVKDIKAWNDLSTNLIKVSQKLKIYKP